MTTFVLASASPARLAVLRAAGVNPEVRVSGVDEDAVIAGFGAVDTAGFGAVDTAGCGSPSPAQLVAILATAKAHAVATGWADAVVVGCDSMLHVGGELVGKPHTQAVARQRWTAMAGRSGELLTGHCVLRVTDGVVTGEATGTQTTLVHFADPSASELEAYLATGEPLEVAGAFTLDGLGGWFVEAIEGDPSSVVGIGLPLVRRLLIEVGVSVSSLWTS
ncbi:MAG: nucleoside triphosphate pyrophosphatase [Mycobacteriaceae bacterium]